MPYEAPELFAGAGNQATLAAPNSTVKAGSKASVRLRATNSGIHKPRSTSPVKSSGELQLAAMANKENVAPKGGDHVSVMLQSRKPGGTATIQEQLAPFGNHFGLN